jgi:hypothetical protein
MAEHEHVFDDWQFHKYEWALNGAKGTTLLTVRKCTECGHVETKLI